MLELRDSLSNSSNSCPSLPHLGSESNQTTDQLDPTILTQLWQKARQFYMRDIQFLTCKTSELFETEAFKCLMLLTP